MFEKLMARIQEETLGLLFRFEVETPEKIERLERPQPQRLSFSGSGEPARKPPAKRSPDKVGRNAPCPCGSGKKFKKCCGR